VNRADHQRWASASTLADVGELTALWLEGKIASQPGYAPGCGPADETLPLVPVLAACNRAGYVTTCSQPGFSGTGYGGAHWEQRAATEGFADAETARRLRAAASRAGALVLARDPQSSPRWRIRLRGEVPATRRDGADFTWFGAQLSRRYIRSRDLGWGACARDAADALCAAWQVTLIDPVWGREDSPLWTALAAFAEGPPAEPVRNALRPGGDR
jgi:hypothetical protein